MPRQDTVPQHVVTYQYTVTGVEFSMSVLASKSGKFGFQPPSRFSFAIRTALRLTFHLTPSLYFTNFKWLRFIPFIKWFTDGPPVRSERCRIKFDHQNIFSDNKHKISVVGHLYTYIFLLQCLLKPFTNLRSTWDEMTTL